MTTSAAPQTPVNTRSAAKKAPAKKPAAQKPAAPAVAAGKAPARKAPAKKAVAPKATAQPAKPAKAPKAVKAPKAPKPAKPVKLKIVRDSFTMPEADFALIDQIKQRALGWKQPAKKSEVLRAALQALNALPDAKVRQLLSGLTPIKKGRPQKAA